MQYIMLKALVHQRLAQYFANLSKSLFYTNGGVSLNRLKIVIVSIVILVVVVTAVVVNGAINPNNTFNPKNVGVENITVTDSKISMKLDNLTSGLGIVGYTVKYDNEVLMIKLISAELITSKKPIDSISMDNKYGKIKEIYIQGDTPSENKLVYPQK
jgi:uncharacterized membrane protein